MATKAVSIILTDGTLNGVIAMQIVNSSTELSAAPRESVSDLIDSVGSKYGVYLLLSDDKVYVGQASDLSRRIKNHTIGKDWWNRAVVITTSDDSLTHTDIDYMEAKFIAKAQKNNTLDCDNKTGGNATKVSNMQKIKLDQHIEESILLLEIIGITVLSEVPKKNDGKKPIFAPTGKTGQSLPNVEVVKSTLFEELQKCDKNNTPKQKKKHTMNFLGQQGLSFGNFLTYAGSQKSKNVFWANPRVACLSNDWDIVLNNYESREIICVRVPAGTFTYMHDGCNQGFNTRIKDNTLCLDFNVTQDKFVDVRSQYDLTPYITKRIKY